MDGVNKTLYIPLYGKAYVSGRNLILRDETAERIWAAEGFPLKGKAKSKWLAYNMGMRSAVFDRWLVEKMAADSGAAVLHLGCGMDSRVTRAGTRGHRWYDVDFPEVIAERKKYFSETEEYTMVSGDLRQPGWLESIPGGSAIVVMEGISMYLTGGQRLALMKQLSAHFDRLAVLMDVYTTFAAKATKYKNPINEVGVTQVYGFDDPEELTADTGLRFVKEHDLTPESMIRQLPKGERGFFKVMFTGSVARKIYRLYEYESENPPV